MKKQIKEFIKKLSQDWEDRKIEQKQKIVYWMNYAVNSIPISFLFYVIFSIFLEHSLGRGIATYLGTLVLLVYYEHYFRWHKEGWRESGTSSDENDDENLKL